MFLIGLGFKSWKCTSHCFDFWLLFLVFGYFTKKMVVVRASFTDLNWLFLLKHITIRLWRRKAKSNSLLYIYNDTDKASWATYDVNLDPWTKEYLGENPKPATTLNQTPLFSKYNSGFTYVAPAPKKRTPKPTVEFLKDSIAGDKRYLT
jgi:hypothetical protein